MNKFYLLLGAALILAVLDWWAIYARWRRAEYLLKSAVMTAILAAIGTAGGFSGWMQWFAMGIFFSLVGDVVLLLPGNSLIWGGAAFFIAQLCYIIGFNPTPPPVNFASLALAILVALTAAQIYRQILIRFRQSNQAGLAAGILVYFVAISLMTLSALITLARPEWEPLPALIVSSGALLLLLSDSVLLLNIFTPPVKSRQVWIMATYHLGQILLILGAGIHYLT